MSDAEVFGDQGPAVQQPEIGPNGGVIAGRSYNGAVTAEIGGRPAGSPLPQQQTQAPSGPALMSDADVFGPSGPPQPAPQAPQALPQVANPTIAQDALSGFVEPFQTLGHDFMQQWRGAKAEALSGPPTSLPQLAQRTVHDLAAIPQLVGDTLGLGAAPSQAVVRPVARAINNLPVRPYTQDAPTSAPRPMYGQEAQAAIEGGINSALSAARPAGSKVVPAAPPQAPMSLDELAAAKNAAYAKVDQSGFTFPQGDVQKLAGDISAEVARKGGPSGAKLYPASTAMSDRITALANQPGGVPLTQLDELRSDIYDALVAPGDRESVLGKMMRTKIDGLIDAANAPDIKEARDLNTRYMKTRAITDKLDSAGLRSASTYSGGNYNNAVRQNIRPLVDPTSAQRIQNLTPDEEAALRQVVQGTPAQNATRYATKILTNKIVQAPVAVMTHGAGPAAMEAVGSVLNKAGQNQTAKAVQKALDLIARGGKPASPATGAFAQLGQPPIPIRSAVGITGVRELGLPLGQILSAAGSAIPMHRPAARGKR